MAAASTDTNVETEVDIPECESTWEPENNLGCPEHSEVYERECSQAETSACASAKNSVKPGKSLKSVDISKLNMKVGVIVK